MYFGTPCYGYALNCLFVYLVTQGTRPFLKRKQKLFYLHTTSKNKIHICSNKHKTGLVVMYVCLYFGFHLHTLNTTI